MDQNNNIIFNQRLKILKEDVYDGGPKLVIVLVQNILGNIVDYKFNNCAM